MDKSATLSMTRSALEELFATCTRFGLISERTFWRAIFSGLKICIVLPESIQALIVCTGLALRDLLGPLEVKVSLS